MFRKCLQSCIKLGITLDCLIPSTFAWIENYVDADPWVQTTPHFRLHSRNQCNQSREGWLYMLVSQIKETDKRLFKSSNMAAKTSHEILFNPNETHLFHVRYVSKQQMYIIFSSLR